MRDFKSFTSAKLKKVIKENPVESRREWMAFCPSSSSIDFNQKR